MTFLSYNLHESSLQTGSVDILQGPLVPSGFFQYVSHIHSSPLHSSPWIQSSAVLQVNSASEIYELED